MKNLDIEPKYVASLNHSAKHYAATVNFIQPRGHIAAIDDPDVLDAMKLKGKTLTLSFELMFVRPMYQTPDMIAQHELLDRVAYLLDKGTLVPTVTNRVGDLTVENLRAAHESVESGSSIGKSVLGGIPG